VLTQYTIKGLLNAASQQLEGKSDSAKLDVEILLSFVLSKPRTYLFTWPEKELSPEQLTSFNSLFNRRLKGEPIAYLVGQKEFWSLTLNVAPSTLIPRADTETLVELVLEHHQERSLSCLDLGTGTGAIALALASENPTWQVQGVDFNPDAVALAQSNAKLNQLEQVQFFQSDWFSNLEEGVLFDVIVSNPPYIDVNDHHLDEGDVRFEPKTALVADNQGYSDIEIIVIQSRQYLSENGSLYIEHGFEQGAGVREIFSRYGFSNVVTAQDLSGNDRITFGFYRRNNNNEDLK